MFVVISSDATESSVLKSIIHGACDYWVQPLHEKQFKTMWQHVARKTLMENKEDEDLGFSNAQLHKEPELVEISETESHKEHHDLGFLKVRSAKEPELVEMLETESHKEDEVLGFLEPQSHQEHEVFEMMEGPRHERKREREDDKAGKERGAKKSRLSWTPQLHQQFVNAVNQLGVDGMNLFYLFLFLCLYSLTSQVMCIVVYFQRQNLERFSKLWMFLV